MNYEFALKHNNKVLRVLKYDKNNKLIQAIEFTLAELSEIDWMELVEEYKLTEKQQHYLKPEHLK